MADVEAKVKEIIMNKLGVDEGQVTSEASFTNDLGADSLDTVELVMEFEKAFNLQIPDEDAEKISTVGDAIRYLQAEKRTLTSLLNAHRCSRGYTCTTDEGRKIMNGKRRVVVTGMGTLTPIGLGVEEFWKGMMAGTSGAAPGNLL